MLDGYAVPAVGYEVVLNGRVLRVTGPHTVRTLFENVLDEDVPFGERRFDTVGGRMGKVVVVDDVTVTSALPRSLQRLVPRIEKEPVATMLM